MNTNRIDELISAYLDGELTPTERETVEEHLLHSEEARSQLQELQEISDLLRSMPAEKAPDELISVVMQRAEREMLIGQVVSANNSSTASPKLSVSTVSRTRRGHRGGWVVLSGLAATVAAVLGLVFILPGDHNVSPSRYGGAGSSSENSSELSSAEAPGDHSVFEHLALDDNGDYFDKDTRLHRSLEGESSDAIDGDLNGVVSDFSRSRHRNGSAPMTERSSGGGFRPLNQPSVAPRQGTANEVTPLKATVPSVAADTDDKSPAEFDSGADGTAPFSPSFAEGLGAVEPHWGSMKLDQIQPGTVIQSLQANGDQVAVVEFTVVDVQKALGAFQLLLSKHEIPEMANGVDQSAEIPKYNLTNSQDALAQLPEGMVALYVQSSQEQLAAAIGELKQHEDLQDVVIEMAMKEPIEANNIAEADFHRLFRGAIREQDRDLGYRTESRFADSVERLPEPADSSAGRPEVASESLSGDGNRSLSMGRRGDLIGNEFENYVLKTRAVQESKRVDRAELTLSQLEAEWNAAANRRFELSEREERVLAELSGPQAYYRRLSSQRQMSRQRRANTTAQELSEVELGEEQMMRKKHEVQQLFLDGHWQRKNKEDAQRLAQTYSNDVNDYRYIAKPSKPVRVIFVFNSQMAQHR